jgi:hypothetical protein
MIGVNDYDKALPELFDKLKELIPNAIENSERLRVKALKSAERRKLTSHYCNPYVDVHKMLLDTQNFIDRQPSVRD